MNSDDKAISRGLGQRNHRESASKSENTCKAIREDGTKCEYRVDSFYPYHSRGMGEPRVCKNCAKIFCGVHFNKNEKLCYLCFHLKHDNSNYWKVCNSHLHRTKNELLKKWEGFICNSPPNPRLKKVATLEIDIYENQDINPIVCPGWNDNQCGNEVRPIAENKVGSILFQCKVCKNIFMVR